MISGQIEFLYHNIERSIPIRSVHKKLLIDDTYLYALLKEHDIKIDLVDKSYFEVTLIAERDILIIENVTIFEQVDIRSFSNTKASFGLLVVKDIRLHIVGAYIDIFRTHCDWVFVTRSLIREFEYSLDEYVEGEENKPDYIAEKILESSDRLVLSYVTIEKVYINQSIDMVIIKSAKIDRFEIDSVHQCTFGHIRFSLNTNIEELSIAGEIGFFEVENSIINQMNFKEAIIGTLEQTKSDIGKVFLLDLDKIRLKNKSAWELLFKSAVNDENDALYAKAGFEINHLSYQDKGLINKISGGILRYTIGYGYRPYRALLFSLVAIVFFAIVFMAVDYLPQMGQTIIETSKGRATWSYEILKSEFFERLYLSGTAYTTTGFGDVVPSNAFTRVLAIIESTVGVSVLSLFMYSLLKRFGKN